VTHRSSSASARSRGGCGWVVAGLCLVAATAAYADTFFTAYYDPQGNDIVVTMTYRGSNPDHQFSLQWGTCRPAGSEGTDHQVVAEVLDSQWNDNAQQSYTKTVRFSLANVACRPATVILKTAPHFEYTMRVP
jgi:hypothetical protein